MIRRFRLSRARLLALALPLAACAPVVTHGPRVEPGLSFHAAAGTARPLCDSGCNAGMTPTFGGGLRYGLVPENGSLPSLLVGATAPLLDPGALEGDVFVQAPSRGEWVFGGGTLASPRHVHPYVQLGRVPAGGAGWYLSAGYAWLLKNPDWIDDVSDETDGRSNMVREPRYFAPGAGFRAVVGGRRVNVYVTGGFGDWEQRSVDFTTGDTTVVRRNLRTLMSGVSVELPIRDGTRTTVTRVAPAAPPAPSTGETSP